MTIQPIFIIGTQRSDSNLLRLMLNQLDEITSPHPPHILKRMFPPLKHYDDLSIPQKILDQASKGDISIFESVAGHVLDNIGYNRAYIKRDKEKHFSDEDIAEFNMENERLKQELLVKTYKQDLYRRDKQASFLTEIRSR